MKNESVYQRSTVSYLLLAALMTAVCAVCSWISIPLPFTPVPINLGTLAVFLTGGILGWKYGTVSVLAFVLLGAAGLPVFHGFTGGVGIITGPTGGYIVGYILAAFLTGIMIDTYLKSHRANENKVMTYAVFALAMVLGLFACYALGTAWFIHLNRTALGAALLMCVVPFLAGDAIKIAVATILVRKLRPFAGR